MSSPAKLTVTAVLLLTLGAVAAADFLMTEGGLASVAQWGNGGPAIDTSSSEGTVKTEGPDPEEIAKELGLELEETTEQSLMAQVIGDREEVQARAILSGNDRAGAVTWVDSSQAKTYFIALKEALLSAFSPKVSELRDETHQEPGRPVINILTFVDPALSNERLTFVRVRERLYEFHVTAGKEQVMVEFIEALATK
jgi:hypothetical protein